MMATTQRCGHGCRAVCSKGWRRFLRVLRSLLTMRFALDPACLLALRSALLECSCALPWRLTSAGSSTSGSGWSRAMSWKACLRGSAVGRPSMSQVRQAAALQLAESEPACSRQQSTPAGMLLCAWLPCHLLESPCLPCPGTPGPLLQWWTAKQTCFRPSWTLGRWRARPSPATSTSGEHVSSLPDDLT